MEIGLPRDAADMLAVIGTAEGRSEEAQAVLVLCQWAQEAGRIGRLYFAWRAALAGGRLRAGLRIQEFAVARVMRAAEDSGATGESELTGRSEK
jgi:hypothetical protein